MDKLIKLFFSLLFCYTSAFAATDKIVASVNDHPIMQSELIAFKKRYNLSDQAALTKLARNILEQQTIKQLHAEVTNAELEIMLQNFMRQTKMNREQLGEALSQEGKTIADFKRQIKQQEEKRRIYTALVKKPPVITDEQITRFIKAHPVDITKIPHHFLDIIIISDELDKNIHSERGTELCKKLRDYLSTHSTYDEMNTSLKSLLKENERIEVQDLGWRNFAELPDLFVNSAKKLKQPNQVSEPLHAENGIHFLKLLERASAPQISRTEAKELLFQQQLEAEAQKQLEKLYKTAVITKF